MYTGVPHSVCYHISQGLLGILRSRADAVRGVALGWQGARTASLSSGSLPGQRERVKSSGKSEANKARRRERPQPGGRAAIERKAMPGNQSAEQQRRRWWRAWPGAGSRRAEPAPGSASGAKVGLVGAERPPVGEEVPSRASKWNSSDRYELGGLQPPIEAIDLALNLAIQHSIPGNGALQWYRAQVPRKN